jgi:phosphomethylpyrimidine synthase
MQTKITDEDLAGLEDILKAKGGAGELAGVKMDKAD